MVLDFIWESWEIYRENVMSFILAELITLVVSGMIALVGVGIIFGSVGISALMEITSQQNTFIRITSLIPMLVSLGSASVFFIIAGLVWIFLKTGIFGMAAQALRGKIKVGVMFSFAKSKGLTGILSCVIVGILVLIISLVLTVGLGTFFPLTGVLVGVVISSLVMVLFSLTFPGIILDNLNTLESIKMSVNIAKRNYFGMLILLFFYFALLLAITFVSIAGPLIVRILGSLIINFFVFPMLCISLVIFYKKKK
jgi:hypothetical protein